MSERRSSRCERPTSFDLRERGSLISAPYPRIRRITFITAAVAYAVSLGFTRPFTTAADVLTGAGCLIGGLVATRRVLGRSAPAADPGPGALSPRLLDRVIWFSLAAIALGYELAAFEQSPRSRHPTLSSLLDTVGATPVGRSALGLSWTALLYLLLS